MADECVAGYSGNLLKTDSISDTISASEAGLYTSREIENAVRKQGKKAKRMNFQFMPFVDSPVSDSRLTEKGLLVLGIERGKDWISVPEAKEVIERGDRLVVYGARDALRKLFKSVPHEI